MKHVESMKKQAMAKAAVKAQRLGDKSVGRTTSAPLDNGVACEVIELMLVAKSLSSDINDYNDAVDFDERNGDGAAESQGYEYDPDFSVRDAVAASSEQWAKLRAYKAKHRSSYSYVYARIYEVFDAKTEWFSKEVVRGSSTCPLTHIAFLENLYRELAAEDEQREAKTYAAKPTEEPRKGCVTVIKADRSVDNSHRVAPDHPDALTNLVYDEPEYTADRTSDVWAEFGAVQEHATVTARSREWWTEEQ